MRAPRAPQGLGLYLPYSTNEGHERPDICNFLSSPPLPPLSKPPAEQINQASPKEIERILHNETARTRSSNAAVDAAVVLSARQEVDLSAIEPGPSGPVFVGLLEAWCLVRFAREFRILKLQVHASDEALLRLRARCEDEASKLRECGPDSFLHIFVPDFDCGTNLDLVVTGFIMRDLRRLHLALRADLEAYTRARLQNDGGLVTKQRCVNIAESWAWIRSWRREVVLQQDDVDRLLRCKPGGAALRDKALVYTIGGQIRPPAYDLSGSLSTSETGARRRSVEVAGQSSRSPPPALAARPEGAEERLSHRWTTNSIAEPASVLVTIKERSSREPGRWAEKPALRSSLDRSTLHTVYEQQIPAASDVVKPPRRPLGRFLSYPRDVRRALHGNPVQHGDLPPMSELMTYRQTEKQDEQQIHQQSHQQQQPEQMQQENQQQIHLRNLFEDLPAALAADASMRAKPKPDGRECSASPGSRPRGRHREAFKAALHFPFASRPRPRLAPRSHSTETVHGVSDTQARVTASSTVAAQAWALPEVSGVIHPVESKCLETDKPVQMAAEISREPSPVSPVSDAGAAPKSEISRLTLDGSDTGAADINRTPSPVSPVSTESTNGVGDVDEGI